MKIYQQGDILLKTVDSKKGEAIQGSVLFEGSHQGNAHSLAKGKYTMYKDGQDLYLDCKSKTTLSHCEHKAIQIPKGIYKMERVLEYDHMTEESKEVID